MDRKLIILENQLAFFLVFTPRCHFGPESIIVVDGGGIPLSTRTVKLVEDGSWFYKLVHYPQTKFSNLINNPLRS